MFRSLFFSTCTLALLFSLSLVSCGVVEVTLVLDSVRVDGYAKNITRINATSPGPTIRATENDTLIIHVINLMADNTTLHWHGMYQTHTVYNDGVPGVTQCPIPSAASITYTFIAKPAGTHFYHGHYNDQMVDGQFGALIIDPLPSPSPQPLPLPQYTKDETFVISDWYNIPSLTMLSWFLSPDSGGNEPCPDAISVNGEFGVTPSLFYNYEHNDVLRLRIINAAAFSMWNFSVDSLPLTLIEVDGTLVEPLSLPFIILNAAQRVSVLVNFSQVPFTAIARDAPTSPSLYFRVHAMLEMYPIDPTNTLPPYEPNAYPYAPPVYFTPEFLGVFTFNGTTSALLPTYDAASDAFQAVNASVFPISALVASKQETNLMIATPLYAQTIPNATHTLMMEVEFFQDDKGVNRGHFNNIAYIRENKEPLLYKLMRGELDTLKTPLIKPASDNKIRGNSKSQYYVPKGAVVDMIINNTDTGEHPFHLHGQEFYVISSSEYPEAELERAGRYIRRDVVSVPLLGWAKIRFIANNPGVWAFHCHIEWHMSSGLFATIVTSPESLTDSSLFILPQDHADTCKRDFPSSNDNLFQPTSVASIVGYSIAAVLVVVLVSFLTYKVCAHFRSSRESRGMSLDVYRPIAQNQDYSHGSTASHVSSTSRD